MRVLRPAIAKGRFVPVLGLAAITAALVFTGIEWGLPSRQRLELAFGSVERLRCSMPYLGGDVDRKGARGQRHENERIRAHTQYYDVSRSYHSDEGFFLKHIANMNPARFDFDPKMYYYPTMHVYLTAAALKAAEAAGFVNLHPEQTWYVPPEMYFDPLGHLLRTALALDTDGLAGLIKPQPRVAWYIANPPAMGRIYLVARLLGLFFTVAGVILTYSVASRLFGRLAGFAAGAFLAVLPIWVIHGHFARVDVPCAFWCLVAIAFALRHLERPRLRFLLAAGAAAGLAASTKYPGAAAIVPVLLAALVGVRRLHRSFAWRRALELCMASCGAFILAFAVTSPYVILRLPAALRDITEYTGIYYGVGQGGWVATALRNYLTALEGIITTMGAPAAALAGLGLLAMLFGLTPRREQRVGRDNPDGRTPVGGALILIGFIVVFFVVSGRSNLGYPNYFVPIVPPLAILAGALVACSIQWTRRSLRALVTLAMCGVWAYTFLFTLSYCLSMAHKDVRIRAAQWMNENLPHGVTIGLVEYPVIYRSVPFSLERFHWTVLGEEGGLKALPEYVLLTNVGRPVPLDVLLFVHRHYVWCRDFQDRCKLGILHFPDFAEELSSALGQIVPRFSLFKRTENFLPPGVISIETDVDAGRRNAARLHNTHPGAPNGRIGGAL